MISEKGIAHFAFFEIEFSDNIEFNLNDVLWCSVFAHILLYLISLSNSLLMAIKLWENMIIIDKQTIGSEKE